MDTRPKTIFCDIDGVLLEHRGDITKQHLYTDVELILPKTLEILKDWDKKGYRIILTTGRREGCRKETEHQLSTLGIIYDILIMGIGGGVRVIINDFKPNNEID